jgi:thiol reductant ABC exporter CydC subunit
MRALLRLTGAPRGRLALAVALGTASVVCAAGLMATAGYLITRAAEQPPILSLTVAIVAVRFFGLTRPLARYGERLASHDVALRVLARVRARVLARIEPLAPGELSAYRDGDLLARAVADVDALQDLHLRGLVPVLVAVAASAVTVGAAAALAPAAGVVLAAGLLAAAVLPAGVAVATGRRSARRQASARGTLAAEIVASLEAAPELAAAGATAGAEVRLEAADRRLVAIARRDALGGGLADALATALTGATVAGVLAVAVSAPVDRVEVALLGLLALAAFEAVTPLTAVARTLPATLGAGARVLALTAARPAIADPPAPRPAPEWPFAVALEDVRARYGDGPDVLAGAALRIEPGERVALVGPSGAGKTTAVRLLLRFLDPAGGRVTLAGRDVRELRAADARAAFAVAAQDAHVFTASIRDNVALARPDAGDAEIDAALDRAQLGEWVRSLPAGIGTLVGEAGRELSGGQRQRLGLARALLSRAPVLVLDEPTAHLDPPAARAFVRDAMTAAEGRSVLLITHRPEGLELADRVLRLERGRISELPAGAAPAA